LNAGERGCLISVVKAIRVRVRSLAKLLGCTEPGSLFYAPEPLSVLVMPYRPVVQDAALSGVDSSREEGLRTADLPQTERPRHVREVLLAVL
jgi:hypothetical protein